MFMGVVGDQFFRAMPGDQANRVEIETGFDERRRDSMAGRVEDQSVFDVAAVGDLQGLAGDFQDLVKPRVNIPPAAEDEARRRRLALVEKLGGRRDQWNFLKMPGLLREDQNLAALPIDVGPLEPYDFAMSGGRQHCEFEDLRDADASLVGVALIMAQVFGRAPQIGDEPAVFVICNDLLAPTLPFLQSWDARRLPLF